MKKISTFVLVLFFTATALLSYGQADNQNGFKLAGSNTSRLEVGQSVTQTTVLKPFEGKFSKIFGLAISGEVEMPGDQSLVRVILTATNGNEYLVYEMYPLLAGIKVVAFDQVCEESCILDGITPESLKIEVQDATFKLSSLTLASDLPPGINIAAVKRANHELRNSKKISLLNQSLSAKGMSWAAGNTAVSKLTFAERKLLYGSGTFPAGMEYYIGGVMQTGTQTEAATASLMIDKWDWRNRHGKNWITSIKNQASCGSCWAFAVTGATEAQVNLYFNQLLNLDLSEQDVLSCSGAGSCSGGYPSTALSYIAGTGIVNNEAFPYTATDQPCANKSTSPSQLIKIAGKVDFGYGEYTATEDNLKKMIIKYGPISGGLYDWSHAMTLVGWQVVKEGDRFMLRDTNLNIAWITVPAGSPLIGQTVWMFKNSWGGGWGDAGYVYVQTTMSNIGWTHALLNPVQSLKQAYTVSWVDGDGDGNYWWGLGSKPAACPGPSTPDGDDSNATLGPLDAYGYCTVLGGAPVASFSADKTTLNAGGTVNFSDLSTGAPTSWSWTFAGGNPATSTSQNPVVSYAAPGNYYVSLTVTNANGSSTKTMTNYITVNADIPTYCTSNGNATREYINSISINGNLTTSGTSGASGYQDFTVDASKKFSANAGTNNSMTITPGWSSKTVNAEAYSVWIDFNHDEDFSDPLEQVLTATKTKFPVSKTISIPSTAIPGDTRMRVSMKRNTVPLACEIFTTGEVEDYTITIIGATGIKSAEVNIANESHPGGTLQIYPNPAKERLTLQFDEIIPGSTYSIYTAQGRLVSKSKLNNNLSTINVSRLAQGMYFIIIENGQSVTKEKFVKR